MNNVILMQRINPKALWQNSNFLARVAGGVILIVTHIPAIIATFNKYEYYYHPKSQSRSQLSARVNPYGLDDYNCFCWPGRIGFVQPV